MNPTMTGVAEMQQVFWFVTATLRASQNMMDCLRFTRANVQPCFALTSAASGNFFAAFDQFAVGFSFAFNGGAFNRFLRPLQRRPFEGLSRLQVLSGFPTH